ncbi:MAG: hypothetical protein DWH82_01260 [Planctomycetota bacterium]|nr:MAG: hypothetical protein DWH82_01260 [Planctomycetota bacterium]
MRPTPDGQDSLAPVPCFIWPAFPIGPTLKTMICRQPMPWGTVLSLNSWQIVQVREKSMVYPGMKEICR